MKRIFKIIIPMFVIITACNTKSDTYTHSETDSTTIIGKDTFMKADYGIKQNKLVDIYSLILKSPERVKEILGTPNQVIKHPKDCALLKHCELEMHYRKDSITVLYEDNKARWLSFDGLQNYKWVRLPEILGLKNENPTTETDHYTWFDNFVGIKRIAFIPEYPSSVSYVTVELQD